MISGSEAVADATIVDDRADAGASIAAAHAPTPSAVVELLKPITWFPPMWAFACGVVSTGAPLAERWPYAVAGALLAGPLVCGTSQAVNDWFDRDVDAINEPTRVVPSGRMPGRSALHVAVIGTVLSAPVALALGAWVFGATLVGLALAWAYSAPPFRLKRDGWVGPGAVGLAYEGLPWFAAAAAVAGGWPGWPVATVAALYAAGALGIMTLNDFKAVRGDAVSGLRSLPVRYGVRPAALIACLVMALPQIAVVALLIGWGSPSHAAVVALLVVAQTLCMGRLLRDPERHAPWYNATGTGLYVAGMMAAALALGSLA